MLNKKSPDSIDRVRSPAPCCFGSFLLAALAAYSSLGGVSVALAQVDSAPSAEASVGTLSAAPAWRIVPSMAADLTYTDNVGLVSTAKKSDLITRLSPGIVVEGQGGHVTGMLNFRWSEYAYANDSRRNSQQRSLAANATVELVDQWLYLDGRGSISQQPISAFGTQGVSNELVNGNRTETSTYQLSPYIKGRLGGVADYILRYTGTRTKAGAGELAVGSGTTSSAWSGRLAGDTALSSLGWSVDLQQQKIGRSTARDTQSKRAMGSLEYRIDPQVKLRASLGRESDDYSSTQNQSRTVHGYGVEWAPTERTNVSYDKQTRSFGDSYSASFQHRTALTAWRLSQSKNVSTPSDRLLNTSLGSAFDLLNLQLTSSIPDPFLRAQIVNQQLQQLGIPANAQAFGTIITSRVYISRRQEASFILTGARNVVTLSANRSDNQVLGTGGSVADDFSLSPNIQQSGFTTSWAHKLSPDTAVTLNGRQSRNKSSTASLDTRIKSLSLLLTTKLGPQTSATMGLRQTRSDSNGLASSYDEQAITGSLFVTF